MDFNPGIWTLLKLGIKMIHFRIVQFQHATSDYEIVSTTYGKVKGRQRVNLSEEYGRYYAFEGIPFAKPPLGELRFRAPQPPEPWGDTVLNCTTTKPKPLQKNALTKLTEGSEDCLYLNVYSKTMHSEELLPVMVYLYGGGFHVGEATRDIYAPDYFMERDVVLVTVNYRVAVLGFLSLNDPDLKIPGNAGLKDQVMALKWIKQNIEYFNGDPNNITLFGESAGATSVHMMMLTPQTRGLFHKAILQSGSALCSWANTPAADWAYRLACHIGFKGNNNDREIYEYLLKVDAKRIMTTTTALMTKQEIRNTLLFVFTPVVEPYDSEDCITLRPFKELMKNAWSNDIPVIIGANSYEGLFHYPALYLIDELQDCYTLIPEELKSCLEVKEIREIGLKLKHEYFGDVEPSSTGTYHEYMDLMSLRTFWHDCYRVICGRVKYAATIPTYCYVFDFDSEFLNAYRNVTCPPHTRGVCHADELYFLFKGALSFERIPKNTPEYKCIQRMLSMWYTFALTSNPNCKAIKSTHWDPVMVGDEVKCLNINDKLEFRTLPMLEKLKLWDSFYPKDMLY